MSVAPALVLDTLQSLLEAEQASIFRFMREGTPYLTRATLDTRRQIEQMAAAGDRHAAALAGLITSLGGLLRPESVHPANQYLSFLTLKFLLPKLADAKRTAIERYENALRALPLAPPEVMQLLNEHLADHRADLATLEAVSAK
jgi:hypothetical protein